MINMITLTSDKHTLVKADFSMKDSVQQEPSKTTPHHVHHSGGFTPPRKVFSHRIAHCSMMGCDGTCQGALLDAYQPQFVGWCKWQASSSISAPKWEDLVFK
jgi:hypothetical protein